MKRTTRRKMEMLGKMKMAKVTLAILIIMNFGIITNVRATATLPDPATEIDGIRITSVYDDFVTYPAKLMMALAVDPAATWTVDDWDVNTGTGGLDVLIYTGAGGQDNDPVGIAPNLFTLQDPIIEPGGVSKYGGIWGLGGASANGPVYVDQVLDYLHTTFDASLVAPVFNFDFNEPPATGKNYLNVVGKVSVIDPGADLVSTADDTEKAFWAFDNDDDGGVKDFDPGAWVLAPNTFSLTGTSGTVYTVNNRGSGRLDYAVVAPDMDLTPWYGTTNVHGNKYQFAGDFRLKDLDGGFTELYMSGAAGSPVVPEPATMLLFGVGGLGLAAVRRRRKV